MVSSVLDVLRQKNTMTTFFIPGIEDAKLAEESWQAIRSFVGQHIFSATDRRIFQIRYTHDGHTIVARVGEIHDEISEMVIAILETTECYSICTPTRGVLRGIPVLVGKPDTLTVENFGGVE
jgi:hypothetical protein